MGNKISNADIKDFLEDVKTQMSDLSATELEGLTAGLAEELQEQRDIDETFRLANAKAYAHELRSAAGLPAQAKNDNSNAFLKLVSNLWKFLKTFETTWFVFRGYLFYPFVFAPIAFHKVVFVPGVWVTILITIGFIVVSLWLGNGRGKLRVLKYPLIVINLLAALASIFVVAQAQVSAAEYVEYKTIHDGGKLFRGSQWVNYICAFDDQGNQVEFSKLTDRTGDTVYTYEPIEPFSKDCTDKF
jgi:hypothetical protein